MIIYFFILVYLRHHAGHTLLLQIVLLNPHPFLLSHSRIQAASFSPAIFLMIIINSYYCIFALSQSPPRTCTLCAQHTRKSRVWPDSCVMIWLWLRWTFLIVPSIQCAIIIKVQVKFLHVIFIPRNCFFYNQYNTCTIRYTKISYSFSFHLSYNLQL